MRHSAKGRPRTIRVEDCTCKNCKGTQASALSRRTMMFTCRWHHSSGLAHDPCTTPGPWQNGQSPLTAFVFRSPPPWFKIADRHSLNREVRFPQHLRFALALTTLPPPATHALQLIRGSNPLATSSPLCTPTASSLRNATCPLQPLPPRSPQLLPLPLP